MPGIPRTAGGIRRKNRWVPNTDYNPLQLTNNDKIALRDGRNPFRKGQEETLNCESTRKFIHACAYLQIEIQVKYRTGGDDKEVVGLPTAGTRLHPKGYADDNGNFNYLQNYKDEWHLIVWVEAEDRWIRARKKDDNVPRVVGSAEDFSGTTYSGEDTEVRRSGRARRQTRFYGQ